MENFIFCAVSVILVTFTEEIFNGKLFFMCNEVFSEGISNCDCSLLQQMELENLDGTSL